MKKKLPIIQSLWIGNDLSNVEKLCISSFLKNGHEFHLYTYGKIHNLPAGTILKDANQIIPESDVFTQHNGSYAAFSDWFRWKLLVIMGNFWVDTDVVCLKPFDFEENELIFGFQGGQYLGSAVLGFPKGHEACKFIESVCNNPHQFLPYDSNVWKFHKLIRKLKNKHRSNIGWGEAGGPSGMPNAFKYLNILNQAKEFTFFYPIHYSNFHAVFNETLCNDINLFSNTYAIHLWNEMLRSREEKYDKNGTYSKKSLFEQLKSKYLD